MVDEESEKQVAEPEEEKVNNNENQGIREISESVEEIANVNNSSQEQQSYKHSISLFSRSATVDPRE